ncbi:MAG: KilA-N domain-containing protein, partial [Oxalobacteraceae bacterium]
MMTDRCPNKMMSNFSKSVTDKNGNVLQIELRPDGYFNATKMCKSTNKQWGHYYSAQKTREFLDELARNTGVPVGKDGPEKG